jgi:hypothetical protein
MQPGKVVAGAGALEEARTRGAHPGWPPAPPHADRAQGTYTPEQQRTSVGAAMRVRCRAEWGSIASCSPARRYQATHVQAHAGAAGTRWQQETGAVHETDDAARAHGQQSTDAEEHERMGVGRGCSLAGQGRVGTGDEPASVTSAGRAARINRLAESRRVQRAHHHQGPLPGRRASFPNVMASLLRRDRCNHWHPATRAVANHIDQRTVSRQAQRP